MRLWGWNGLAGTSALNFGDWLWNGAGPVSYYTNGRSQYWEQGSCLLPGAWQNVAGQGQTVGWDAIGAGTADFLSTRAFDGVRAACGTQRTRVQLPTHIWSNI